MNAVRYYIFSFLCCSFFFVLPAERSLAFNKTSPDTLTVAEIFSNHMVLQRNQTVNVWGTAAANQNISVDFNSRKYKTAADGSGHWTIYLPPLLAGGPYEMEITEGNNTIRFHDIYTGDVWLASGQSNMAFRFKYATDPDKETVTRDAGKYTIRMYEVAKVVEGGKLLDKPDKHWAQADQATVADWSAVAFYFGKGLSTHLNIPIGIINCSQGASTIESWMSGTSLASVAVPEKKFTGIQSNYKNPSVLYEGMLAKIIPFSLKGVIWYQGESNSQDAESYQKLLPALIRLWRRDWNQSDLPFLFAQLPGYQQPGDKTDESWAMFRKAQEAVAQSELNTGMVVLIDAGDKDNIHPANKRVVGERLVLAARSVAYHEDLDYSGPILRQVSYKGKQAVISYDHAEEGLELKGKNLSGFFVCSKEGTWYPATAKIKKHSVVVYHPEVREISAVRYGWANAPVVNLYNKAGLPAAPFNDKRK